MVFEAEKDKKDGTVKLPRKSPSTNNTTRFRKPSLQQSLPQKKTSKAGIVWHTQGSGKSLTMVFYTGKMVLEPQLENPTVVLLTDRNDLDDQLFGTFSRCHELLRQKPRASHNQRRLKELFKFPQAA